MDIRNFFFFEAYMGIRIEWAWLYLFLILGLEE